MARPKKVLTPGERRLKRAALKRKLAAAQKLQAQQVRQEERITKAFNRYMDKAYGKYVRLESRKTKLQGQLAAL